MCEEGGQSSLTECQPVVEELHKSWSVLGNSTHPHSHSLSHSTKHFAFGY